MKRLFVVFATLAFTVIAHADGTANKAPSANYNKAKKLLPGEKVVTPTGQKMKVWSTKGPVEVSPAPEPFKDKDRIDVSDTHIMIDAQEVLEERRKKRPSDK